MYRFSLFFQARPRAQAGEGAPRAPDDGCPGKRRAGRLAAKPGELGSIPSDGSTAIQFSLFPAA